MNGLRRWLGVARERETLVRVSVVGALRTGTNYLKFLLESNYFVRAEFDAFGWKHGGVPILPAAGRRSPYPDIPLFYVVKNPFAFVLSLHRYHRRKLDEGHRISLIAAHAWEAFVTSPIVIFDSQLPASPQMRFANPVQYWNFIYWNLENLDRRHFRVHGLNYEDLVADPERVRDVEQVVRLTRRHDALVTPGNALKRLADRADDAPTERYETKEMFDAGSYTTRRYMEAFTESQREFVRSEANPWLMERRGYGGF